jgi:hypothetical protein
MPAPRAGRVAHACARQIDLWSAHARLRALLAALVALSLAAAAPAQGKGTRRFSGRLELFHTDGKGGHDTYTYELRTKRGSYVLHFAHGVRPPSLERRVTLRGTHHGHRIAVRHVIGVSARRAAAVSQAKKLAVILVNFADNASQPYSAEEVRQLIWTGPRSVRAYYSAASFGQLELGSGANINGDVYGYYTIPYSEAGSSCPYEAWQEAALAAARSAGVDLSAYTNIMFFWPEAPCGWAGAAYVGGRYSYMNGSFGDSNNLLAAHELGHNFGLYHAHSLVCHDAAGNTITYNPNESYCQAEEYGDPYDRMGSGTHYEFNNYFKGALGWWPSSAIQTVTSSGTYLLQPDETLSEGAHLLRVVQRTFVNGEHRYYYLEFRQPSFFDDWSVNRFTTPMWVEEGVSVRLGGELSNPIASELLNMNPTILPAENPMYEWFAQLMPGETYTDPVSGTVITTNSASPLGASVTIALPAASTAPPTVSITSPANGGTASGNVTVAANASDSSGVSSVALAIDGKTAATLTQAPYSMSWNTTTVANGQHTITATAKDGAGQSASASATVTVSNTSTSAVALSAPSGLFAAGISASQAALSWNPCTDSAGVTSYEIFRNGAFLTSVAATRYVDVGLTSATSYSYQVRAQDAAGHASGLSGAARATTTNNKPTGALAGWVTSKVTGLPVGSAKVTATLPGHSWSVNSSPAGFYLLSNLAPGTYSVTVAKGGYATQSATLLVLTNVATVDGFAM